MQTKHGTVAILALALLGAAPLGMRAHARSQKTPRVATMPAQTGTAAQPVPGKADPRSPLEDPNDPFRVGLEAKRARLQTDERHKRIVSDTEKLLHLSTELKADVEKSTKDELSMDVIRKAAEIEKLAHDVKERMRG